MDEIPIDQDEKQEIIEKIEESHNTQDVKIEKVLSMLVEKQPIENIESFITSTSPKNILRSETLTSENIIERILNVAYEHEDRITDCIIILMNLQCISSDSDFGVKMIETSECFSLLLFALQQEIPLSLYAATTLKNLLTELPDKISFILDYIPNVFFLQSFATRNEQMILQVSVIIRIASTFFSPERISELAPFIQDFIISNYETQNKIICESIEHLVAGYTKMLRIYHTPELLGDAIVFIIRQRMNDSDYIRFISTILDSKKIILSVDEVLMYLKSENPRVVESVLIYISEYLENEKDENSARNYLDEFYQKDGLAELERILRDFPSHGQFVFIILGCVIAIGNDILIQFVMSSDVIIEALLDSFDSDIDYQYFQMALIGLVSKFILCEMKTGSNEFAERVVDNGVDDVIFEWGNKTSSDFIRGSAEATLRLLKQVLGAEE